jgi:hypothetical protein
MTKGNRLLILGSGGHGWESIKHVIDTFSGDVEVTMLPVDWGGSTGTIGRLMKLRNCELNKILHNDSKYPVFPFGDLNKFVAAYLEENCDVSIKPIDSDKQINCLEFRSDSYTALMRAFVRIISCLELDREITEQFEQYLKSYLEYYLEFKDCIANPKTTALGNIWHSFLFYRFKGMDGLVGFYKSKKILPLNLSIQFTSSDREILQGSYQNEENQIFNLDGEDLIDDSDYPIDPNSFKLLSVNRSQKIITPKFISSLKSATTIIIPNGSLANWLPFVNIKEVARILHQKSKNNELIWVMNLFHGKNEYPFDVYYHYLSTFGINPIILGPISIPAEYYVSFLKEYQKEGKTLNYNFNTQAHNGKTLKTGFNNQLDVVTHLEDKSIEGVKYDKECVKDVIQNHLAETY